MFTVIPQKINRGFCNVVFAQNDVVFASSFVVSTMFSSMLVMTASHNKQVRILLPERGKTPYYLRVYHFF
jgi:hypothetical protein